MQSRQQPRSLSVQVIIIFGFGAIVYMLFLITTSVYKDYKIEQSLLKIKNENVNLFDENETKKEDLFYFSSAQFKDKFAKQNLGKVNPGEKIIVFAEVEENIFFENPDEEKKKGDITAYPNIEQWYEYFFGDNYLNY
jgi:cell division protein FtsB